MRKKAAISLAFVMQMRLCVRQRVNFRNQSYPLNKINIIRVKRTRRGTTKMKNSSFTPLHFLRPVSGLSTEHNIPWDLSQGCAHRTPFRETCLRAVHTAKHSLRPVLWLCIQQNIPLDLSRGCVQSTTFLETCLRAVYRAQYSLRPVSELCTQHNIPWDLS